MIVSFRASAPRRIANDPFHGRRATGPLPVACRHNVAYCIGDRGEDLSAAAKKCRNAAQIFKYREIGPDSELKQCFFILEECARESNVHSADPDARSTDADVHSIDADAHSSNPDAHSAGPDAHASSADLHAAGPRAHSIDVDAYAPDAEERA